MVKIPLGKEGFVDKALRQMMQAVQALLRAVPSVFRGIRHMDPCFGL